MPQGMDLIVFTYLVTSIAEWILWVNKINKERIVDERQFLS